MFVGVPVLDCVGVREDVLEPVGVLVVVFEGVAFAGSFPGDVVGVFVGSGVKGRGSLLGEGLVVSVRLLVGDFVEVLLPVGVLDPVGVCVGEGVSVRESDNVGL